MYHWNHRFMHFGLCLEPPLYQRGFTDKEYHRALKQRETDHKWPKTTARFCWTLIYNCGRRSNKQSCSSPMLSEDVVCSYGIVFFRPSRIFWGAFWRGAVCCLFCDSSEVTLISMKFWERRGTASNAPTPPHPQPSPLSLESTSRLCEPVLSCYRDAYVWACGRHMAKRGTSLVDFDFKGLIHDTQCIYECHTHHTQLFFFNVIKNLFKDLMHLTRIHVLFKRCIISHAENCGVDVAGLKWVWDRGSGMIWGHGHVSISLPVSDLSPSPPGWIALVTCLCLCDLSDINKQVLACEYTELRRYRWYNTIMATASNRASSQSKNNFNNCN